MIVTKELIEAGESGAGGWNAKQLWILGITWPPRQGWKHRVIGRKITKAQAKEFVELKGKVSERTKKTMAKKARRAEKRAAESRSEVDKTDIPIAGALGW